MTRDVTREVLHVFLPNLLPFGKGVVGYSGIIGTEDGKKYGKKNGEAKSLGLITLMKTCSNLCQRQEL